MIDRDLPLKKEIAENIKRLMTSRGWKQIDLSEKSGISKSTLSDYLNCKTLINLGNVEKIAQAFGVGKAEIDPSFNADRLYAYDSVIPPMLVAEQGPDNVIEITPHFVRVPILGTIACGNPILAEENFEGYMYELEDGLPSGILFELVAKGDSMEPTIPNGSKVLIREQNDVEYGEIAAVLINGNTEATLKRVKKQGSTVLLMPDNQNFEPIVINENNPMKIIGKAVRVTRDLI